MSNVTSYTEADAFLHTRGKPVPRKKIANNTYLVRLDPTVEGHVHIAVVLHKTAVLTWFDPASVAGGEVILLNTGGWFTVTTKERINRFLPGNVFGRLDDGSWGYRDATRRLAVASLKGRWYVHAGDWQTGNWLAPFNDGMVISREGDRWVTDSHDHTDDDRITDSINRYVRGYEQDRLDAGEPCLIDPDTDRAGLLAFIESKPYSYRYDMVYAALEVRGYRLPEFIMSHSAMTKRALRDYLKARLLTASMGAKPASSREDAA